MQEPKHDAGSNTIPNEKRKVFFGLFVFPLLIAVTMAVLLSGIVLLTHEEETPESLITAIKTGTPSKRWQKAFELSNELNRPGGMIRSGGIMKEVIHILQDKEHYDARTRAYMAMTLSRFREPEALRALNQALEELSADEDPSVPLFLMWGIGNFESLDSAPAVKRFLESENPDLRKTAAYVLGVLKNPEAAEWLKSSLDDSMADVRWNAALALARLGDESGRGELIQMLDRARLAETYHMDEPDIERTMINAAKGLALIQPKDAETILKTISVEDPNLKVREAALKALNNRDGSR